MNEAFADPSGGRRGAFTLSIAHRADERCRVDLLRAWKPPLNPAGVVAEAAELLRAYDVRQVRGDRYAGEWPAEQFRAHGIEYLAAEKDRSALYLYLDLVAHINASSRRSRAASRASTPGAALRPEWTRPCGPSARRARRPGERGAGVASLVLRKKRREAIFFQDTWNFTDCFPEEEEDRSLGSYFDRGTSHALKGELDG